MALSFEELRKMKRTNYTWLYWRTQCLKMEEKFIPFYRKSNLSPQINLNPKRYNKNEELQNILDIFKFFE